MIRFTRPIFVVSVAVTAFILVSMVPPPKFKVIAMLSKAKDHNKMMTAAVPFLKGIAGNNNFTIDISDDTSLLNDANLSKYTVLVQLQEAPFDMSAAQQASVQKFVDGGKGWVGIHAAGLTGKDFVGNDKVYWQWFENLMGGVVYSPHPAFQKGTVVVEDRDNAITKGLPERFEISDEWYEFDKSPRPNVHVLATADEKSYKQNKPMGDHPIIWTNPNFRRMVYIGIGHDVSMCTDPNFTKLVTNSILWANSK